MLHVPDTAQYERYSYTRTILKYLQGLLQLGIDDAGVSRQRRARSIENHQFDDCSNY